MITMKQIPYNVLCFDFDLWSYDIGYAAESQDSVAPFSWCRDIIDARVQEIYTRFGVQKYYGYLTGKGNFREQIGTQSQYKGNRTKPKPVHFENIRKYLQMEHNAVVVQGMEADDAIAIDMTKDQSIICVSRDKDLRQVQGWHFGYAVGKQPEFPLQYVDFIGTLTLPTPKKIQGTGIKFFWSQVLTGDATDNYKGLPKCGPVAAYNALSELECPYEMYDTVLQMYLQVYPEDGFERFKEQCQLAWMVRSLNEDGSPLIINAERGFWL